MADENQREGNEDAAPTPTKTASPPGLPNSTPTPTKAHRARGSANRKSQRKSGASDSPTPSPDLPLEEKQTPGKLNDNAVTARLLKTKMCYFFERGKCASTSCRYAHSTNELRTQPNLQKTKLCKTWAQHGVCLEGENCFFAHGETELRVTDGIYKTQMCHFFERGRCLKGDRCNHAHGTDDLRRPPPATEGSVDAAALTHRSHIQSATMAAGSSSETGSQAPHATDARTPLSPLPLAELLVDSPSPQANRTGVPMLPGQAAAGMGFSSQLCSLGFASPLPHSPVWGMPWTPATTYGTVASPTTSSSCIPALPSPASPAVNAQQSVGYGMAWSSPSASVDLPAGVPQLTPYDAAPDVNQGQGSQVACDLSKRLASLDVVVRDLAADIRDMAAGQHPKILHRI